MVCVSSIRGLVFECQSRESEKFAGFLSVGSRGFFFVVTENGRGFRVIVRGLYGVHRR